MVSYAVAQPQPFTQQLGLPATEIYNSSPVPIYPNSTPVSEYPNSSPMSEYPNNLPAADLPAADYRDADYHTPNGDVGAAVDAAPAVSPASNLDPSLLPNTAGGTGYAEADSGYDAPLSEDSKPSVYGSVDSDPSIVYGEIVPDDDSGQSPTDMPENGSNN